MRPSIFELLNPATAELLSPPEHIPENESQESDASLDAVDHGTDLDASLRFAELYSNCLRYCPGVGWLHWDKRRWAIDREEKVLELSKKAARQWTQQAAQSHDDRERRVKTALMFEGASHIKAAIDLAKCDARLVVSSSALDRDPWKLNVLNGTLDLRTGQLTTHNRSDLITKIAPVTYRPNATHPTLNRYLEMIEAQTVGMPSFLARCFGAALSGDATTETLFLLQGEGGSGKTTLVEAIAAMLGDYSAKLQFESFCQSKHGRSPGAASPDLIPLRGSRMAYASEGDQSARLDAGVVKALTGNEPITARNLYSEPITFPQTWKLWLVSNFDPKAESEDTGIWRRMMKLQFTVIPEAQRDPSVKRTLIDDPDARSALLSWTLTGCADWQARGGGRKGLAPPNAVESATAAYRAKQDTLGDWWEDLLTTHALDQDAFTPTSELRRHYDSWCDANGASPVYTTRFNGYLESKGLVKDRKNSARGWRGIKDRTPSANPDMPDALF